MERILVNPRQNYVEKIKKVGFEFYEDYWLENAYYRFSTAEIDELEKATKECYDMYCSEVGLSEVKPAVWESEKHLLALLIICHILCLILYCNSVNKKRHTDMKV